MADYHRDVVKTDHDTKRRAERRAELAGQRLQEEAPLSRLQIDGRGCKIHRNTQEYENIEQMKVMVPWNGDQDCLIDRFDARSMLDFYRENKVTPKKTDEELEMEERVAFEAFRDIVKLLRKGLKDSAGLAYVENEALDIRVKARSKASADAGVRFGPGSGSGMATSHIPTVVAAAAAAAATSEAANAAAAGVDEGDEDGDTAEDDMIDAAEDDAAALDRVGAECGIPQFTAQLQRAVIQEEEDEQENDHLRRKKPGLSRRKMAMRVKRMLGEGLNPFGKSRAWFKETLRPAARARHRSRASPDYGPQGDRSARRGSWRGAQPAAAGQREYISEFTAKAHSDSESSEEHSHGGGDGHLEARPGQVDPAAGEGPVALPAAANVVHGKREFTYRDREEERAREAERGKITMNEMRVSKAGVAPGGKEKPADRLKRLMAAQFNGNVAADTKKQLERRQEQEREQRAQAAVERHALAVPRGRAGAAGRRHGHGGGAPERRRSPFSRSRSPQGRYRSEYSRDGSSTHGDRHRTDDRRRSPPRGYRR
eukprot:jgi/Ulvmu1/1853/UM012_0009.1